MKKLFLLTLLVCLCSFAQPAKTDPGYPAAFDQAYWSSQPTEIRALQAINDYDTRGTRAGDLAVKGFTIDREIMVYRLEPFFVMKLRADFGYTWVPSALQAPVSVAPGISGAAFVPYDPTHPPAGSIKVSTDIKDFPPFDPPAPPAPLIQTANFVGPQSVGTIYYSMAGDPTPDGASVKDDRGTFIKHKVQTPFGFNVYYEKQ